MKIPYCIVFIMISVNLIAQRAGDLYTDFGENGIYTADWTDTSSLATDLAVFPNGNLLVAGQYNYLTTDLDQILAMALDPLGNPVLFGNFSHGFEYDLSSREYASTVLILPDNKILIAGSYTIGYPDEHPFIIRLNADGSLDEEFAEGGVYTDISNHMNVMRMEIYQQEETYSIILCGGNFGLSQNPLLTMISQDGELVTDFGTDGFIELGSFTGNFIDLEIDNENNKLYVCGILGIEEGSILAKYNLPDGSPDTEYSEDGVLVFSEEGGAIIRSIVLDTSENTLALFGNYLPSVEDDDIFAIRIDAADASPDVTFGASGFSTIHSPTSDEYILSAILQSDGKYYFGGYTDLLGTPDFMIGRINHNGIGDTSFGTNGFAITDQPFMEGIYKIALSSDEELLFAVGYDTDAASNNAIVIAAYHTTTVYTEPEGILNDGEMLPVRIYPNPVTDIVTLETGNTDLKLLQVFDLAGHELVYQHICSNRHELNLDMLQPSVYFIRVTLPDGQAITSKIIKH